MTAPLAPGDPAPWFVQRSTGREDYHFETVAGRYVALTFFGSAADPETRALLDAMRALDLFDDMNAAFFGVSCDPADERERRVREKVPGFRVFWDFDLKVTRLYGLALPEAAEGDRRTVMRATYLLDPGLRVIEVLPLRDPARHAEEIAPRVRSLLQAAASAPGGGTAPVLVVPHVFESAFCRRLIEHYEAQGGDDSGYVLERDGRTAGVIDYGMKRRRDRNIEDETLRAGIRHRLRRRLDVPMERAFCFLPTRMERYIVACYDASEGGYFRPHRDNTTRGTAHRRFAVTINLNAEEYEGGDLRFPEFGSALYRAPTGGAVIFSCSLMHEAMPVTRGRRYACLPFLYDEAAAEVRRQNLDYIADDNLREAVRASIAPPVEK